MRIIVLAAAALTAASFAGAADAATYGGQAKTLPAAFSSRLAAVCQSQTLMLTSAAKSACTSGAFPRVVADASAFVNIGVGAELNTLMRQLPTTVASK